MGYSLRKGLTFCEVSGRLVFLDAVADRYFSLAGPTEVAFRNLLGPGSEPGALAALPCELQAAGLLVETADGHAMQGCQYRVADASLLDIAAPMEPDLGLVAALVRLQRVRRALRHGRLSGLLDTLARAKVRLASDREASPEALRRLALGFELTARLTRSHDQCLARSIALAQLACHRRLPVDLVIGVRLHPFAAHCWVQSGHWLLNDHADSARTYTPILVL